MPDPRQKEDPRPQAYQYYFREYKGINTQADRTAIDDNEFAWLENYMPIGSGNLRVVPAQGTSLVDFVDTPYVGWAFNINKTDYAYTVCTNGAAYQALLTSPFTKTKIANAGTFSGSGAWATQWKNERILFIDPTKGYFSWDGTVLVQNGGVATITITNGGSGYLSVPTVVFSSGTAAATAVVSGQTVVSITVTNGGSGYGTPPTISFSGGGGGTGAAATANVMLGPGMQGIQQIIVTNGGTAYATVPTVAFTGGGGTGAAATAVVTNQIVTAITITNTGTGYTSVPTVTISGGGGSGALAYAVLYPTGGGQTIATSSGRVWIGNGRTEIFSAPDSFTDFTLNSSGGFFTISDSTLHDVITSQLSSNNYLYILSKNAVDVLSDVRVVSGITLFTRVNVEATVGSASQQSMFAYYRAIMFSNMNGMYAITGSTPDKVSDALDGIIPLVDFTQPVSGGMVSIYNILCAAFCFTYNDPLVGARQLIAINFSGKWFLASQGVAKFVFSANINTQQNLYGIIGTQLFQLFSNTTATVATTMITKLWDLKNPILTKQMMKFGLWAVVPTAGVANFTVSFDNETGASVTKVLSPQRVLTFTGTSLITFTGISAITWLSSGLAPAYTDASQFGKYLGYTITSTVPQAKITLSEYEYFNREPW